MNLYLKKSENKYIDPEFEKCVLELQDAQNRK
jgi:hypothetical protein